MTRVKVAESSPSIVGPRGLTAYGLILAAIIVLFATLSIYLQGPPAALPESASPESFSSGRAMKHLRIIARNPHPLGSTEHDVVRDYVFRELNALGLSSEIRKTTVISDRRSNPYRVGTVQNIVGRIPGTSNSQSVLLVGHYDSVPNSPGASDDGSAVAALLETARALKSQPPLKNDVVFLFTDAEEAGLLGAEAFVREHPSVKDVGVVLNFEARGTSGPAIMFETSDKNGWLIQEFSKAAPHPVANSLSYEIYKRLPNDTDLTIFRRAGFQGLNFAYINQLNRYHAATDSLENIDERSLQHQGASALALARHFGNLNASRATSNAVYFNLLGPILVHYPQWLVLPLAVLVTLLFAGVIVLGFKQRRLSARGLVFGFIALVVCAVASSLTVMLVWRVVRALHRDYDSIPGGDVYNNELYILGFVFLVIAVTLAIYNWFRRRTDTYNLTVGGLGWWLALAVVTSLSVPGASYLFIWPLLFTLVAFCLLFIAKDGRPVKTPLVLALYIIPGIILLTPLINQIFIALTLSQAWIIILFEVLLLGLLLPHLDWLARPARWLLPGACALIGLGLILVGLLLAGFDHRHPKADSVFYALQADTGTAAWGSTDKRPDEWTAQFFGTGEEKDAFTEFFPFTRRTFLKGVAPAITLPPPEAVLVKDETEQGIRTLRLRLTSPRKGSVLSVYADASGEIVAASVNGEAFQLENTEGSNRHKAVWAMNYYGFPEEGTELTLSVKTNQPVKLRIDDRTYGLPQIPGKSISVRPDYIIPTPSSFSDVTIVSKSYTF